MPTARPQTPRPPTTNPRRQLVKIRITGLPDEVDHAATEIARVLTVIETSTPYPCRGNSRQVRLYLEARLP